VRVETALQMRDAVDAAYGGADIVIAAAAVADFRPAEPASGKLKKNPKGIELKMISIADELPRMAAKKGSRLMIGFAAETDDLAANAKSKLARKRLDLIVANDVTQAGAGFAVDTNIVTFFGADGSVESLPILSKDEVADKILDRLAATRAAKSRRLRVVRG
jgi:phosphopantothenoylcysteine decarboxylase/phosphopantothenate--cysteine ligase